MSGSSRIWACLPALLLAACGAKQASQFPVVIRVESDPGHPLAGVQLSAVGQPLGATDDRGSFTTALRGLPGETVELSVACPTGYRTSSEKLFVLLRVLAEREKRPEYRVQCAPTTRQLVLAVRAEGAANVPVRVLGEEIARTDKDGVAHAMMTLAPGETVMVKLDTSDRQHAMLMPRDPELRLVMPNHDEVVLFDQTFTRPAPPPRPHKKREPVGPQRI